MLHTCHVFFLHLDTISVGVGLWGACLQSTNEYLWPQQLGECSDRLLLEAFSSWCGGNPKNHRCTLKVFHPWSWWKFDWLVWVVIDTACIWTGGGSDGGSCCCHPLAVNIQTAAFLNFSKTTRNDLDGIFIVFLWPWLWRPGRNSPWGWRLLLGIHIAMLVSITIHYIQRLMPGEGWGQQRIHWCVWPLGS